MNLAAKVSYLTDVDDIEGSSGQIIIEPGNLSRSFKTRRVLVSAIVGMSFVLLCGIILVYFMSTKDDKQTGKVVITPLVKYLEIITSFI